MNYLLINASFAKAGNWSSKLKPRISTYPSLALTLLAALVPPEDNVRIINEEFEEIDFEEKFDLVGISFLTPAAPRAYEIAATFRKKGITVIMGGVHVTALPEEAAEHADTIVVGEAETVWPVLLNDFKNGTLKKRYKADGFIDLANIPRARLDLLNKKHYVTINVIQASRGCSFGCEFCSIAEMFGKKARFRPVEKVIEEIKMMGKQRVLLFTDDNLIMNPPYARKLLTALKPLKLRWIGEASWTIGNKPEILKLMQESGCVGLLIGFESIQAQTYTKKISRHKDMREAYMKTVKALHDHQIAIVGAFIFGFDNDTLSTLDKTLQFCLDADIDIPEFNGIIPYPGTPLYRRLSAEGRIFSREWQKYTYEPPGSVFHLKNMKNEEMNKKLKSIYRDFYSYKRLIPRLIRAFIRYRNLEKVIYLFIIFLGFRKKTRFE